MSNVTPFPEVGRHRLRLPEKPCVSKLPETWVITLLDEDNSYRAVQVLTHDIRLARITVGLKYPGYQEILSEERV